MNIEEIDTKEGRKEKLYNELGNEITNQNERPCAKVITLSNAHNTKSRYFVRTYGGQIYDPLVSKTDFGYRRLRWEFNSISEEGFNHYINYLQNRNANALRRAERVLRRG